MKTKFLLVSLITLFWTAVTHADVCDSVIQGASLEGYQGRMGGYDGNGLCHIRDISESDCRRLTGGLFKGYSADNGKGFTHCAFYSPQGGTGGGNAGTGGTGGQSTTNTASQECEMAAQDVIKGLNRLSPNETMTEVVDVWLLDPVKRVDFYCPKAGKHNTVTWALGKYKERWNNAKAAAARVNEDARRKEEAKRREAEERKRKERAMDEFFNRGAVTTPACNASPAETNWCAATAPGIRKLSNCFETPTRSGESNWTFKRNLSCPVDSVLAVVATYNSSGSCVRQIVSVSTRNPSDSTISSVPRYGNPRIIEEISGTAAGKSADEMWLCYSARHESCGC